MATIQSLYRDLLRALAEGDQKLAAQLRARIDAARGGQDTVYVGHVLDDEIDDLAGLGGHDGGARWRAMEREANKPVAATQEEIRRDPILRKGVEVGLVEPLGPSEVDRAAGRFDFVLGLLPRRAVSARTNTEVVGDALERIDAAARSGRSRWYLGLLWWITLGVVLVEIARYVVRGLKGQKALK